MKTLVFLPKAFIASEFSSFVDVLGLAANDFGYDTKICTCGFKKTVISTFNISITVDKVFDEIIVNDYSAIAIPGGFEEYGYYDEVYDERFFSLLKEFNSKNKIIATIFVAALPLGKSGILRNRNGTTYCFKNGYRQNQLKEFGVNILDDPIVTDGNIITSNSPQT